MNVIDVVVFQMEWIKIFAWRVRECETEFRASYGAICRKMALDILKCITVFWHALEITFYSRTALQTFRKIFSK